MPTAVWKGLLSFGLVSIPVRLHRAARKERIPLHYVSQSPARHEEPSGAPPMKPPVNPAASNVRPIRFEEQSYPADSEPDASEPSTAVSRIRQKLQTDDDGAVAPSDIRRGYEVAPGRYVTFEQPELQRLRRPTSPAMEIIRSVRLAEIDPVFFETSYYVAPVSIGERAYGILWSALRETGYVALATVAMHGRDHIVLIRPGRKGLLAHIMFYVNEVRPESEYAANAGLANPKEMELARAFVEAIAGPFAPEEFQDTHNRAIQQLIADKIARGEEHPARGEEKTAAAAPASTPDIMEALRRSLELRKPPAVEKQDSGRGKPAQPKRKSKRNA